MTKRVLDVGNCAFDHGAIRRLIEREFAAQVAQADDAAQALAALGREPFDLVLVNRKFDGDGGDGLELIRAIKQDGRFAATPVMLISNYGEYQQQAVAAGAEPGFGKSQLGDPAAQQKLRKVLE
jgi:CheY-like chemotaxis protein